MKFSASTAYSGSIPEMGSLVFHPFTGGGIVALLAVERFGIA
jgi:hypothetical protein